MVTIQNHGFYEQAMIAVVKDDSRLYSFNKTLFRVLQCAEMRSGFGQNQKPETCHDKYSLFYTLLTNLIWGSWHHALWNRATTTIKRVTIERSSEDLTISSNSFLFSASGFLPFVSRGRNTLFTSD